MEFHIIWSGPAKRMLDEIIDYIAQDNPSAAWRLEVRIIKKVDLLTRTPLLGSVYPPGRGDAVRETREGNYRIFYEVSESDRQVEILAIWHSARQEPHLPLDD